MFHLQPIKATTKHNKHPITQRYTRLFPIITLVIINLYSLYRVKIRVIMDAQVLHYIVVTDPL